MKKISSQDIAVYWTKPNSKAASTCCEVEGWELATLMIHQLQVKTVIHLGAISDTTFSALDEIKINNSNFR